MQEVKEFVLIYKRFISVWLIMFGRFINVVHISTTLANLSWIGLLCRTSTAEYRTENANAMFAYLLRAIIAFICWISYYFVIGSVQEIKAITYN